MITYVLKSGEWVYFLLNSKELEETMAELDSKGESYEYTMIA